MSGKSLLLLLALLISFGAWQHFHHRQADVDIDAATRAQVAPIPPGTVVVYGRDSCAYTQRTLATLRNNNVPTTYRNIDDPAINNEFQAKFADSGLAGARGFALPIVEIGGHASSRPDPSGLMMDFRISQRLGSSGH